MLATVEGIGGWVRVSERTSRVLKARELRRLKQAGKLAVERDRTKHKDRAEDVPWQPTTSD